MTAAQSEALLGALCDRYPLAVLSNYWQLSGASAAGAPADVAAGGGGGGGSGGADGVDEGKVAELFRRLLANFDEYRRAPSRFEGLLAGLNRPERRQLEALVSAFWDWGTPAAAAAAAPPAES
eukprot:SAG22_NODE_2272_length_2766_cov_4.135358_2_plen_123_part_00